MSYRITMRKLAVGYIWHLTLYGEHLSSGKGRTQKDAYKSAQESREKHKSNFKN